MTKEQKGIIIVVLFIAIIVIVYNFVGWFGGKEHMGSSRTYRQGGISNGNNISGTTKNVQGIYDSNGRNIAIDSTKKKQITCASICQESGGSGWEVHQYPKGSKYYPNYECWCHMD